MNTRTLTNRGTLVRWGLLLLPLWLSVSPSAVRAAEPYQVRFADPLTQPWRITRFRELEGRGVRCMAEDKSGTMWFGVGDGVVRYDGLRWESHGRDEGLTGSRVEWIAARADGSVVAATQQGLFQWTGAQKWTQLFPFSDLRGFPVTYVTETSGGVLWACSPCGLLRLQAGKATLFTANEIRRLMRRQGLFDSVVALPNRCLAMTRFYAGTGIAVADRMVTALSDDSPAKAAGMRAGDSILTVHDKPLNLAIALRQDADEPMAVTVERSPGGEKETIQFTTAVIEGKYRSPAMHSVMEDSLGRIWAGALEGDVLMSEDGGASWKSWEKEEGATFGRRPAALETSRGEIWVVSMERKRGVSKFDGSKWSNEEIPLLSGAKFVSSSAQTIDGTIWVGGLNRLHLWRHGEWKSYDTRDLRIPGESHRMLVTADDALWILGFGQYPVRIALSPDEFMSIDALTYQCSESSGARWFIDSDTDRIIRYDGEDAVSYGGEDDVIDDPCGIVAVPGVGVVAFGSHERTAGVCTFDGREWTRVIFPQVARSLSRKGFTVSRDNRVWIAARGNRNEDQLGGVVVGLGDDWQHLKSANSPAHATSIIELPDGRMMFTGSYGVAIYDGEQWSRPTDEIVQETPCPGGAIDSHGTVWLATRGRGVLRYRGNRWTAFTTNEGLLSNETASIAAGQGNDVWVSTTEGLCRFDGSRFHRVEFPDHFGRKYLRAGQGASMWLDGNHRYVPDKALPLVLPDEKSINIERNSSALITWRGVDAWNRTSADDLRWSFRIDGGSWSPFRQDRQLVLKGLTVGSHRVHLRARDNDFNQSYNNASVAVSVLPPLWMRPWFVSLVILGSAVLAWQSLSLIRAGFALRRSNAELKEAKSQMDERFAEKSAQFRTICDCSPIGIFVSDVDGKPTYVNRYLERIAGISATEGLDGGWVEAIHPDDRDHVVRAWKQACADRASFQCAGRFLHRDGTIKWFDVVAEHIVTHGEIIGYVGTVEDVSMKVISDEELRQSNLKLSRAIEQLERAQSHAIKRERLSALGQMAAGVAHDMNNSLSPLLTYSELLASQQHLEGANREWIELIRLGVSDTVGIVRRLEHFYRDTHHPEVLVSIDLSAVVAQSIELTRPKWQSGALKEGKQVDVRLEKTASPLVDCQPAQIRSVLTNLIFNAVDAIEEHGTVIVRLAEQDDQAILDVTDDGKGMTSQQVSRCLEPFYTSKARGSGLGLSECHGVIRQHGGTIEIESQPGRGTRIRIRLATSHRSADPDQRRIANDAFASPADHGGNVPAAGRMSGSRVLYIDDDLSVRQSTAVLLQALGAEVETVADGPSGLKRLAESKFQLVMCDQGLPEMDGVMVLREIKRRWPDLPVVIISGWSLGEIGDGVQPDGFLEKPVAYEDLVDLLGRCMPAINTV